MSDLAKLQQEVEFLLSASDTYGVFADGFWENFNKAYDYKPDPNKFGKSSLIALFDLFPNVEVQQKKNLKRNKGVARYVTLKQGSNQKVEAVQSDSASADERKKGPLSWAGTQAEASANVQSRYADTVTSLLGIDLSCVSKSLADLDLQQSANNNRTETRTGTELSLKGSKRNTEETPSGAEEPLPEEMSRRGRQDDMDSRHFIYHTYGRDGSNVREESQRRDEQTRHSRWDQRGDRYQPEASTSFQFRGQFMMPGAVPLPAVSAPMVYGMPIGPVGGLSPLLQQAQARPSAQAVAQPPQQSKPQQVQAARADDFIRIDSSSKRSKEKQRRGNDDVICLDSDDEDDSKIGRPPPPQQYEAPPSATARATAAITGSAVKGRSRPGASFVSKQELERVAADCIDR